MAVKGQQCYSIDCPSLLLYISVVLQEHLASTVCRLMLTYLESAVTKNAGEKKVHSLLDWISHAQEPGLLQEFYTATLDALALV